MCAVRIEGRKIGLLANGREVGCRTCACGYIPLSGGGQMTLGSLASALASTPPNKQVAFDFGWLPTHIEIPEDRPYHVHLWWDHDELPPCDPRYPLWKPEHRSGIMGESSDLDPVPMMYRRHPTSRNHWGGRLRPDMPV